MYFYFRIFSITTFKYKNTALLQYVDFKTKKFVIVFH
jgi:hypothetical protein